uniref:Uncharacterized protein n=1 Tax=Naja naja TaxID=35670 RepID=A0A8C6V9C6_NAJNA
MNTALLVSIVLLLEPRLSLACLQCDLNFASHFSSYAPKLSRKSWGLGVVPVAGRRLRGWVQDTLQELNLKISPDIRELSPKQGWPIYLFLLGGHFCPPRALEVFLKPQGGRKRPPGAPEAPWKLEMAHFWPSQTSGRPVFCPP